MATGRASGRHRQEPEAGKDVGRDRARAILAIGQSHLAAHIRGYQSARRTDWPRIRFLLLSRQEFRPPLENGKLNARILEALQEGAADYVFCAVAGNEHNALGLVNHPRRFDFVLPEAPTLPLQADAEILPSGVVLAWLKQRLERLSLPFMRQLREAVRVPIWALEPPPPIPSEGHIERYAEPVFRARIEKLGIAPAVFRFKVWRLQSALLRGFCEQLGIGFIDVPAETQDPHGMLAEPFWWRDATHANGEFGYRMLEKAIGLAASRA